MSIVGGPAHTDLRHHAVTLPERAEWDTLSANSLVIESCSIFAKRVFGGAPNPPLATVIPVRCNSARTSVETAGKRLEACRSYQDATPSLFVRHHALGRFQ